MELSYALRLACWTLFSQAVLFLVLSIAAGVIVAVFRARIAARTARWQEQFHFAATVLPHAASLLIATLVALPMYLRQENNPQAEHVGWLSIAVALVNALWIACVVFRIVRYVYRAGRSRIARKGSPAGVLLAVTGLLKPRIAAGPGVLQGKVFPPDVLAIALAHEESHLRHHDNLRLFILSTLCLKGSLSQAVLTWRRMVERAADDDAAAGIRQRAILLAEALIIAARSVSSPSRHALVMELLPSESELENRVNRLLADTAPAHGNACFYRSTASLSVCAILFTLCVLLASSHVFAEVVFRIG